MINSYIRLLLLPLLLLLLLILFGTLNIRVGL